jgi:hypothetical protein
MTRTRCQICGKRKHLRKNSTIVHHCVGGPRCPGSGHPPIEQDDAWLVEYAARVDADYQRVRDAIYALQDRRANFIDPALIIRRGVLAGLSIKLSRRIRRHQSWAERYARTMERDMMTQGWSWADAPPAYLVQRLPADHPARATRWLREIAA